MVTVFWPFTTTDAGATFVHTAEEVSLVAVCNVNVRPAEFVGHDKIIFGEE